jgi:hypothetical protein
LADTEVRRIEALSQNQKGLLERFLGAAGIAGLMVNGAKHGICKGGVNVIGRASGCLERILRSPFGERILTLGEIDLGKETQILHCSLRRGAPGIQDCKVPAQRRRSPRELTGFEIKIGEVALRADQVEGVLTFALREQGNGTAVGVLGIQIPRLPLVKDAEAVEKNRFGAKIIPVFRFRPRVFQQGNGFRELAMACEFVRLIQDIEGFGGSERHRDECRGKRCEEEDCDWKSVGLHRSKRSDASKTPASGLFLPV